jgi:hypothetical protein
VRLPLGVQMRHPLVRMKDVSDLIEKDVVVAGIDVRHRMEKR